MVLDDGTVLQRNDDGTTAMLRAADSPAQPLTAYDLLR